MTRQQARDEREPLGLSDMVSNVLDESRMVLPGIQALFGFQLIAVFNARFQELGPAEQVVHLAAIGLVAISVALMMGPAAYHRQAEPETVSRGFVRLAGRLMLLSMSALTIGICMDFYLIARLVLGRVVLPIVLSVVLFCIFVTLWFVLPRYRRLQRLLRE